MGLFDFIESSQPVAVERKAKNNVLPHTQAKLDLYSGYLEIFLAILSVTQHIREIHIYDLFCGAGLYDDGKEGSALISYNILDKVNDFIV